MARTLVRGYPLPSFLFIIQGSTLSDYILSSATNIYFRPLLHIYALAPLQNIMPCNFQIMCYMEMLSRFQHSFTVRVNIQSLTITQLFYWILATPTREICQCNYTAVPTQLLSYVWACNHWESLVMTCDSVLEACNSHFVHLLTTSMWEMYMYVVYATRVGRGGNIFVPRQILERY